MRTMEEQMDLESQEKLETPRNRPKKSLRLAFPYSQSSVDVSLWESRPNKNGKLMPSSISLRMQDLNPTVTRNAVFFKAADALKIANILQNFAYSAMQDDYAKRSQYPQAKIEPVAATV